MCLQIIRGGKPNFTNVTSKWFVKRMDTTMALQARDTIVNFATNIAGETIASAIFDIWSKNEFIYCIVSDLWKIITLLFNFTAECVAIIKLCLHIFRRLNFKIIIAAIIYLYIINKKNIFKECPKLVR